MSEIDVAAYLNRINYKGPLFPSPETLRELQVAHLRSVPFENLSIHLGEPIVLDDQSLFNKVVRQRRGGFCYELNGLFAALLRAHGFEVDMLSAAVANSEGVYSPDFAHMTLLVTLQQRWLVDVGFGDSFLKPLLLDERGEQVQGERGYTIAVDGDHLVLNQRLAKGEWKPQYRFTLEPRVYADYEALCRYQQTSPNSHFTRARICTLATTEGRVTLSEMRLIRTTADGTRTEQLLSTSEEYSNSLRDLFGIVLAGMPKQKTQADLTPA